MSDRVETHAYGLGVTLARPYEETVEAVRGALGEQGFGVLTEIDVRATMQAKLGVEMAPQVILGACNPPLAHRALTAEPSIGLLLPCNVVVRAEDESRTHVEALDPGLMAGVTGNPELEEVAAEARERLSGALAALGGHRASAPGEVPTGVS